MTAFATATDSLAGLLDLAMQRLRWRSNAWMFGLLLIVIASIASSLSYTARADRDIDRQFQSKLALYRQQAERINELEQVRSLGIDLATQAAFDASLIDTLPRSRALAEISNAMSPGIRLSGIDLNADVPKSQGDSKSLTAIAPANAAAKLLDINGVASSEEQLSQFVSRLGKSPWLHAVNLLPRTANWGSDRESKNFEVQAVFSEPANPNQK